MIKNLKKSKLIQNKKQPYHNLNMRQILTTMKNFTKFTIPCLKISSTS